MNYSSFSCKLSVCVVIAVFIMGIHRFSGRNYASVSADLRSHLTLQHAAPVYEQGYTDMENEEFHTFIKQHWLKSPPRDVRRTYTQETERDYSQVGQSFYVDMLMHRKRNGFFIECGAADGKKLSNTLFFEKYRSWTGLLIEANPVFYSQLLKRGRNVFSINSCLSPSAITEQLNYTTIKLVSGIVDRMHESHLKYVNSHQHGYVTVTCFPLYGIMRAMNVSHVDYFSLDVEGPELAILKTIPFEKLTIDVLSIEYRITDMQTTNYDASLEKLKNLREFFNQLEVYTEVGILPWNNETANVTYNEAKGLDVIFKRNQ